MKKHYHMISADVKRGRTDWTSGVEIIFQGRVPRFHLGLFHVVHAVNQTNAGSAHDHETEKLQAQMQGPLS